MKSLSLLMLKKTNSRAGYVRVRVALVGAAAE